MMLKMNFICNNSSILCFPSQTSKIKFVKLIIFNFLTQQSSMKLMPINQNKRFTLYTDAAFV